ncbi:hypothetical protein [uncultured Brevibacillus sp.]|uniref:hypothetical protein n=1 Tax=uncultured Brevibacillus sp. TaxID=169970 RepID=UPI0025930A6A|nr:hypothetical protein [uncultured Brevibacillus sp.]
MTVFIGILLILWGIFIVYASLFRMKKKDLKDQGAIGASGFFELELLLVLTSKLPAGVVKGFILLIGVSFIALGTVMI